MAEYVQHITLCDRCRAGEQGEGLLFYPFIKIVDKDTGKFSNMMINFVGAFRGAADLAFTMGWEERDFGHICPECIKEEKEDENFNNAEGTVTGALYEKDIMGEGDEDLAAD
jgi:hypothetical protein